MPKQLSPKDINLVFSALRRAFARSDLHKQVEDAYRIEHEDPRHPKCKKWSWCGSCGVVTPTWRTQIDHKVPVCPLDKHRDQMTVEEIVERMWCSHENLWALCKEPCHREKTNQERALRPKRPRKRKA